MSVRILPPLSTLFRDALRLARSRLLTLLALALAPLIPLALTGPFVAQVTLVQSSGMMEIATALVTPWTALLAFVGVVLSLITAIAAVAGRFITLGSPDDPGPRAVFLLGARRWVAVAWTQFLAGVVVCVFLVPSLFFSWWAQHQLGVLFANNLPLALAVFLLTVVLALPALIVWTWYAFAVIFAAREEAWGPRALAMSHRLVHGATGQVFGFLLALVLFELLFSLLLSLFFPGLVLFQVMAYYLATAVLESAYLVALSNALRRT